MARKFLTGIDLVKNELLNAVIQNLAGAPSSPVKGQIYFDTGANILYWYNGSGWIAAQDAGGTALTSLTVDNTTIENIGTSTDPSIRVKAGGISNSHINASAGIAFSKMAAVAADFSLSTHKLTNVVDPTNAQDAATKNYVDTFVNGLSPKDTVRVATTANGTLSTAFANGQTIDGVTLATGDRILLKNQTTGADNGIYLVAASGAPARTSDATLAGDLLGALCFVSEGTTNGNTLWVMTTDAPITVGTTSLVWSQFGGPGAVTGGTGITVTGQSVALTSPVALANGGTGQTSAAQAAKALVAVTRFATDVGDGASTSITVTHNLNTKDVMVVLYDKTTPFAELSADVTHSSVNTIALGFTVAPTSSQYRCVVFGVLDG